MGLGIQLLQSIRLDLIIDVTGELTLVPLLIVVGERLHVLRDVTAKDVLAQSFGVELLALDIVARETLLAVRNVQATVRSTLHGAEHTRTGRRPRKANIEETLEGPPALAIDLGLLGERELSIRLRDTLELVVDLELVQRTTRDQETGAVSGGPVGQAMADAVALELVGVGGDEDLVANDLGADDLADDVLVGEADDQAVLGRVVFVLRLGGEALAGVVVGLAGSAALVLDLVAREIRTVLDKFGLRLHSPRVSNCRFSPPPKHLAETLSLHPPGWTMLHPG